MLVSRPHRWRSTSPDDSIHPVSRAAAAPYAAATGRTRCPEAHSSRQHANLGNHSKVLWMNCRFDVGGMQTWLSCGRAAIGCSMDTQNSIDGATLMRTRTWTAIVTL